ncbi:hypothetical protein [Marinobacterium rhizophilum]|uniref:DDE family transposase n=1 Tax=Marinobacterium rhizophilum TaxID=420402 RepID=A0ABY5HI96_9GAMM|nr:hypothetical protein [Marinobacterium rhizophilum]UTW12010.1 hypothetical protein KDW95_22730 [Marinobacterium rhizophilum]
MSLSDLFADFSRYLHSETFRHIARHPEHPNAFTRQRKLPAMIAVMLTGLCKSFQAEVDQFFGHLQQAQLNWAVSEQAFALPRLNDFLIDRVEQAGFVPRWRGLRLVAGDGSTLRFGLRASHVLCAADRDQIAFGLYLPGAEMVLAASLHSVHEGER